MKPSSTTRPTTRQTGYALILMVIALMGIGGVVIGGFTQDVKRQTEHERYLHNQCILNDAKQALLQYAYNYPVINPERGPGRLPCPKSCKERHLLRARRRSYSPQLLRIDHRKLHALRPIGHGAVVHAGFFVAQYLTRCEPTERGPMPGVAVGNLLTPLGDAGLLP